MTEMGRFADGQVMPKAARPKLRRWTVQSLAAPYRRLPLFPCTPACSALSVLVANLTGRGFPRTRAS